MSLNTRPPSPRLLIPAIFLYAASVIKFFDRDPLSMNVGPQGPIQLAVLVMVAFTCLLILRRQQTKLVVAPSAKAFLAFGAIAIASSVFSFYPLLSFAKGLSFILVCGIAIAASSAIGPVRVIKYLYYSIVVILAVELVVKFAGGWPLMEVDDYSGRAHLSLFGLHPTLLGELSAVTLLSSFLLLKRPPLYCQVFLFGMNIAADSRTSFTLLIVILLAIWLATVRPNQRFVVFVGCCLGALLVLFLWVGPQTNDRASADIASVVRPIYGDAVVTDLPSLNGRTNVWNAAAPVIAHSIFLGYGLGGARDVLVHNTSWGTAGDAHNAYIELILAGGFPAVLVFLSGWAGAIRRTWRSRGALYIAALGLYAFIAGFGLVAPDLTNLQALSTFLIITVDAMVCAEFSSSYARKSAMHITTLNKELSENPAST